MDDYIAILNDTIVGSGSDAEDALKAGIDSQAVAWEDIANGDVYVYASRGRARVTVEVD